MKTIFTAVLILALGITGISLWGAVYAQRSDVSSSQIFIHGTPVCVMQHAGEILASVGVCGAPGSESREDGFGNGGFHEETPSPHGQRRGLPPGHPPIDTAPPFGEERRILI